MLNEISLAKPARLVAPLAALLLAAIMLALPAQAQATAAYTVSPKMNEAALGYMNEMYVQKYPAMGTEIMYGSFRDKTVLKKLAGIITSGKATPEAKCTAIVKWASRNIKYQAMGVSSYPIDVFATRTGNCYGYACLMQQLMRESGVTAVVCGGYMGDMQSKITLNNIRKANINGHAWVMAYWNGAWHLYDVLSGFGNYGIADKATINKNYFIENIEGVTPYYAGMDMKLINGGTCIYRIGGRMVQYYEGAPCPSSTQVSTEINEMPILTIMAGRGYGKVGDNRDLSTVRAGMLDYELWCDGWVNTTDQQGCIPVYVRPNGIAAVNTFMTFNDSTYYFNNNGQAYRLSKSPKDTTLTYGVVELLSGTSITFTPTYKLDSDEYYYWDHFDAENRALVSVNQAGTLTAKKVKEGSIAAVWVGSFSHEQDNLPVEQRSNGYGDFVSVYVTPTAKTFDYTDHNSKANPLKVKNVKRTVKAKKVKKKAVKVKGLTVKKAQGKVTYKRVSGSKKLSVDKKTGKVKVKKGTKKGTYKIKIKVTAAGKGAYKKGAKKGVVTVKVK